MRDSADVGSYLRPGDVVKLVVWREDDITGEYPVDRNGILVVPKLGSYDVRGETPESLRARLLEDFSVYLKDPSVDVIVLRRVKVLGAVHRPGLFTVDPTMALGDALALAGGVHSLGRRDRIRLVRDGRVLLADLTEDVRLAELPLQSGDEIYVPEKGWLARNVGLVVGSVTATVGLMIAVLVR